VIPRTYRVARLVQPIAMLAVFAIVGFSKITGQRRAEA
jgi:hypothetical protein